MEHASSSADASEVAPRFVVIRLEVESREHARPLAASLLSFFVGASERVRVFEPSGRTRDDLDLAACVRRFRRDDHPCASIELSLLGANASVEMDIPGACVQLVLPVVDAGSGTLWLQCDPDELAPQPTLALPIAKGAFAWEALHSLVRFASVFRGFLGAASPDAQWSVSKEHEGSAAPPLKYEGLEPAAREAPTAGWWEELDALVGAAETSTAELRAHLDHVYRIGFPWELVAIDAAPTGAFVTPASADTIARLVPLPDRVVVAVDLSLRAALRDVLLHVAAHLELGHVRPGDPWGHWDSVRSIREPTRVWDREAHALRERVCPPPTARRVSSLTECTPLEKAWLVLHGHISKMVGEARTLHPAAERYQSAAYQRQAAQRLITQLEDYGGAMLCDGVGLGKTYVATTVLVHYANAWRDHLAASGGDATTDPFRVTVLAPNSVVSTWRREALPALAAHGVPLATVRVVSHTKLSRIVPTSELLAPGHAGVSDLEHLLLSDLVIVDEAHNFRSVAARRTVVLRDLLRLQPRKETRRKVLLLTATPVNNSLEDLRQQTSLLFAKPLFFNDNSTPDGYRARVPRDVEERVRKARALKKGDAAALVIHGSPDETFKIGIEFRDDIQFGVHVPRVGDYLKEQDKLLQQQRELVRAAMMAADDGPRPRVRVASELLDRVVVQRSRALCKQIEREQGSSTRLLFRPDAAPPEKLVYEDAYDDTHDVLARFLPLFDTTSAQSDDDADTCPLSLKVYMWADVRDGLREPSETSSVVGLQRVLVLKRLESTPVAFLITLLRLVALHAHRLHRLLELCRTVGDRPRGDVLAKELDALMKRVDRDSRDPLDLLLTGEVSSTKGSSLLARWSAAHQSSRPAADTDDSTPQLELFELHDDASAQQREHLDRLWGLREPLLRDLRTLLHVAPGLVDLVFGRFERTHWPRRFIVGGTAVDWPVTAPWGMRLITDAKLRRLVARLLRARRDAQKAIVFSQFTDTLAYLESVLAATRAFDRRDQRVVLEALSRDTGFEVTADDVRDLAARTAIVSGETDDRDAVINTFAPFYRLGPHRPAATDAELVDAWAEGWRRAMREPVDVLLASDVLAEGVNLQDASLLVNYDVHWNPVRMIQRAGRIDRRLSPSIEDATRFPDLEAVAAELGRPTPSYWWHAHPDAAPITANLLLPDELEEELQLRERIANKTLAIDFTLGLEQGTGAEADWMDAYRYQGISALNAWQSDRAIERVAGYQERLRRLMGERGIDPEWVTAWNGWLREVGVGDEGVILAWAKLGRKGGEAAEYTRQLRPRVVDGVAHWLWTTAKPLASMLNFWLEIDQKTFPARIRNDLPYSEDASRPIGAEDLLLAAHRVVDEHTPLEALGDMRRPLLQGASAISAGFLGAEPDRRDIAVSGYRILQLGLPPEAAERSRTNQDSAC